MYPQPGCRVYDSVYNRRRTLTADIHAIMSIHAKRGTRQAIKIPKNVSCATTLFITNLLALRATFYSYFSIGWRCSRAFGRHDGVCFKTRYCGRHVWVTHLTICHRCFISVCGRHDRGGRDKLKEKDMRTVRG